MEIIKIISNTLQIKDSQVAKTIELLDSGATIPFISRYRKEVTGALDEVQIGNIKEQNDKLQELVKRREFILTTIESQDKLTPELKARIEQCWNTAELEDIYLPYKPKRRTRAEIAREKGLEPLALLVFDQNPKINIQNEVKKFISDEIPTFEDAIAGVKDIMAEWISENEISRNSTRNIFERHAYITSKLVKGKEKEGDKYRDYFDVNEKLSKCSSHRLLAMRRGEAEGILKINISPEEDKVLERLDAIFLKDDNENELTCIVADAIEDSYKRLLKPSIETEFSNLYKEKADAEAIKVFTENLRQLLLAAPLGQKRVLAIDPGLRTGCKVVCLDSEGNLLHNETIYPHAPVNDVKKASSKIIQLVETYNIEAIAIGNGTASRETENFITHIRFNKDVLVFVVSENGASIYSASKIAREEFPEYDVTVRGAVSIGRRLMDPLAELVKIDPKSIGVGQYQHDVDQAKLKKSLDQTVESCVNLVGVNLNTASKHLLTYVSGLGSTLAQNIVDFRAQNGAFKSRKDLLKVPRMGAKTFEQCAGFLRISDAKNPLDNSAVHPESYHVVEKMAKDLCCNLEELISNKELKKGLDLQKYVSVDVGLLTLEDIVKELDKPGRDPREQIKQFQFDPTIRTINDLKEGMKLPGIVTNITKFGCFVDVGVKENGLIHVSELADRFVSDPTEIVSLHQHVEVRVKEIDIDRKRIALSLKDI